MTSPEEFSGRLRGFVISVADYIAPDEANLVMHLIDHGEGGEAMLTLAWIIVESNWRVPSEHLADLRALAKATGVADELPEELDRNAVVDHKE